MLIWWFIYKKTLKDVDINQFIAYIDSAFNLTLFFIVSNINPSLKYKIAVYE